MHHPYFPAGDVQAGTNRMQASINRLADVMEDALGLLPPDHPAQRAAIQLQYDWAALALSLRDAGMNVPRCEHDEGWPEEFPR
ncbi:hypothetical protein ABB27_14540 [Stenotrophomonas terrae]|uniref:Uncharacterized protein n=2 Tax=Stenotrophomonas terrae TaxID=405446 RepID=A0A0R0C7Z9_9GAMM|nr:hypothetical protein ABB27_14540 [Stenotrophomonas terrae]